MKLHQKVPALSAACLMILVMGCSRQPEESGAPASSAAVSPAASAPTDAATPAGPAMDSAIDPGALGLTFRIIDGPYYDNATDQVAVKLELENTGASVLSSAGQFPVNLGLTIIGPDGTVSTPPGNLDFQRIPLAGALAPGTRTEIQALFPVGPTLGGTVVLDGVQEGVSWFGSYGKPTLTLGKFARCRGEADSLCDEAGEAIKPIQ